MIRVGKTENGLLTIDPMRLVDTRMLIQANSGGGKSWLLRVIAEQTADRIQTIILDPEGEFATLREKLDMALVGRDGEVQANVRASGLLARKLLELRVSTVIDLYDLKLAERREFIKQFIESLLSVPKSLWHPVLIAIDESHKYCPESGSGKAESTNAIIDLVSQGRKRGFGAILATQRMSKLHKDATAELNNVFIGRCWQDVDRDRAGETLGMSKSDRLVLRDLPPGQFFAFGPALSQTGITRVEVGAVKTTHPKAGERHTLAVPQPSAAIQKVVSQLADLPQKAEEEIRTLADAKKKVAELQRLVNAKTPVVDQVAIDRAVNQAVAAREKEFQTAQKQNEQTIQDLTSRLKKIQDFATLNGNMPSVAVISERAALPASVVRSPTPRPERSPRAAKPAVLNGDLQLNKTQQRILDALAWYESIGNSEPSNLQVGAVALIDPTGGHFSNNVGPMSTNGLIVRGNGSMRLTDAGRAAASLPEQIATIDEYHDVLRSRVRRVRSASNRTVDMLNVIIGYGGSEVSTETLGGEVGIDHTGGHFSNTIGPLSTLGLIERRAGVVRPTEILFPPGLN